MLLVLDSIALSWAGDDENVVDAIVYNVLEWKRYCC